MKKQKVSHHMADKPNLFDQLPDDLVVSILCNLGSSASSPPDFFNALLTVRSRRWLVLSKLGAKALVMKARNWSKSALRFLVRCAAAGNVEACYILGMNLVLLSLSYVLTTLIDWILLLETKRNRKASYGKSSKQVPCASRLLIKFNGSGAGGSKAEQNPHGGVDLCMRAASLGHWDAVIELGRLLYDGHCLYGSVEGRRLFSVEEAVEFVSSVIFPLKRQARQQQETGNGNEERHPVNVFLKEWFESKVREAPMNVLLDEELLLS
ncbi:hypothetical protein GQ457_11G028840 [Hibiscus cannabinus]